MRVIAVTVRICSEMDSVSTSGLCVCSALCVERQPPFAPQLVDGCHPDSALPVLCKVVYRHDHATSDSSHRPRARFYLWSNGGRLAKL